MGKGFFSWLNNLLFCGKKVISKDDYNENLPNGHIYDTSAGLQCRCPNYDNCLGYNKIFIDGFSSCKVIKCERCGTEFNAIVLTSIPRSGREFLNG